jgi:hypothetical protein
MGDEMIEDLKVLAHRRHTTLSALMRDIADAELLREAESQIP